MELPNEIFELNTSSLINASSMKRVEPPVNPPVVGDEVFQAVSVSKSVATTRLAANPGQQFTYSSSLSQTQHCSLKFGTGASFPGSSSNFNQQFLPGNQSLTNFEGQSASGPSTSQGSKAIGFSPPAFATTSIHIRKNNTEVSQFLVENGTRNMINLFNTFPHGKDAGILHGPDQNTKLQSAQTDDVFEPVKVSSLGEQRKQEPQIVPSASRSISKTMLSKLDTLLVKASSKISSIASKLQLQNRLQQSHNEGTGSSELPDASDVPSSVIEAVNVEEILDFDFTHTSKSQTPSSLNVSSSERTLMRTTSSHEEYIVKWVNEQHKFTNSLHPCSNSEDIFYLSEYLQISNNQFEHLVSLIEPLVTEDDDRLQAVLAFQRLSITLNYLVSGDFDTGRAYMVPLSKREIFEMITKVCKQLYDLLKDDYITLPQLPEQWRQISLQLDEGGRFLPNCYGTCGMWEVLCNTLPPGPRSGKIKFRPALVMTAIIDGNHNFLFANIEKSESNKWHKLFDKSKDITQIGSFMAKMSKLEKKSEYKPYFVGSYVMPNKSFLLSQFDPKVVGNLRSSMTSCFQETLDKVNAHGLNAMRMLVNVFPVLKNTLRMCDIHAHKIVLGCVALFNYLRKTDLEFFKLSESINNENCSDFKEKPLIITTSCFREVPKQEGDDFDALRKRDKLMHDIYNNMIMKKN